MMANGIEPRPLPLWGSLILFGIPTLLMWLATHWGIPALRGVFAGPDILCWFVAGGIVFFCLFVAAIAAFCCCLRGCRCSFLTSRVRNCGGVDMSFLVRSGNIRRQLGSSTVWDWRCSTSRWVLI